MRAVIQRVNSASVLVDNRVVAGIQKGLLIFLGIEKGDTSSQAQVLAKKVKALRIFNDHNQRMNRCVEEVGAQLLVISQVTLCANLTGGRRPNFDQAEEPKLAKALYLEFIQDLKKSQLQVAQGIFKAYMTVRIENDGPVTFILDSVSEKEK